MTKSLSSIILRAPIMITSYMLVHLSTFVQGQQELPDQFDLLDDTEFYRQLAAEIEEEQNEYERILEAELLKEQEGDLLGRRLQDSIEEKPGDKNYFNSTTYFDKDYRVKLQELWQMVNLDRTPKEIAFEDIDKLWREQQIRTSFYFFSDEIKPNAKKVLHQQGVTGKVAWHDLGDHPYTGILDGGSKQALMRFSESDFYVPESPGLAPSFALKFPATGRQSINVLTRVNFEPSDSHNFWDKTFRHRNVPPFQNECKVKTIQRKFNFNDEGGDFASFSTGISSMAKHTQKGANVTEPYWPFELTFRPVWERKQRYTDATYNNPPFQDQITEIKRGDQVLRVFAREDFDTPDSELKHIANIFALTSFRTSNWADERLHFNHENISFDNRQNKKWFTKDFKNAEEPWFNDDMSIPVAAFPDDRDEAEALVRSNIAEYGCPFAWLLNYDD